MTHRLLFLFALVAGVFTIGAAPAPRDWSATVGRTVAGNFVIGNPDAPVKLVEYLSYTCPHCAVFVAESKPVLRGQMVRSGSTRLELRNAIRDKLDQTAALLARCAGPSGFVGMTDAMFAQQAVWLDRGYRYLQANDARLAIYPEPAKMRALADASGLTDLVRARGMDDAAVTACLSDRNALATLVVASDRNWTAMNAAASPQTAGTPSFEVNGKPYATVDWAGLEKTLRAAGAK